MSALPPGPRTPAAFQTTAWLTRHIPFLERCRRRYGDAFTLRFSTLDPLVFVSDPDSIKRLFSGDRENTLPSGRSLTLEPVLGSRSVLLLEGEEHMRRRKLMLPPFHGDRMRAYEEGIAAVARAEIATWPRGASFELRPRMQSITLEVILAAVFGVADGPRHDELRHLLGQVLEQTRRPLASALAGRWRDRSDASGHSRHSSGCSTGPTRCSQPRSASGAPIPGSPSGRTSSPSSSRPASTTAPRWTTARSATS